MLTSFVDPFAPLTHPLFAIFAWALAAFYSWIPIYAVAIVLLTLAVMVLVFQITRRIIRSTMRMQLIAPELKRLQSRYTAPSGASPAERLQLRQQLNEATMALYRQNGVSPTAGCLPMLLQFPIFFILYGTIRGLTHLTATHRAAPLYLSPASRMYRAVVHAHGALWSFGINLADSLRTAGVTWSGRAPYLVMILVAVILQYVQIRQLNNRTAAEAPVTSQVRRMQMVMPVVFALVYLATPAAVTLYFIVSSLFRIAQQSLVHRHEALARAVLQRLRRQRTLTSG